MIGNARSKTSMSPRRAGQFAIRRARWLLLAGTAAALVAGTISFLVPRTWLLPVGVVAFASIGVAKATAERAESWLKGAWGEQAVGAALEALKVQGYVVEHDRDIGHGNADHVVIGPTGVFAVETKAWNGSVYPGKGGKLTCKGFDKSDAVKQARAAAMTVKKRLANAGIHTWVDATIVLTRARVLKPNMEFSRVRVMRVENLCDHIRSRRPSLSPDEIVRAHAALLRGNATVRVLPVSFEGPLPTQFMTE